VTRPPYPLAWPPKTGRTKPSDRMRSKFGARAQGLVSPYEAAKEVLAELERLGASHVVITSLLPTRHDGLPYSDGRAEDPGVAVWCVYRGHERVFACDQWTTHGENLRAIALSIEALRGLQRWGMADVADRAFAGFAALPAGSGEEFVPKAHRPWREVLGGTWPADLERVELLVLAKARHRKAIATAHPDAGGSHDVAAELNTALAEAEAELGGSS